MSWGRGVSHPDDGGWRASALEGESVYVVVLIGRSARRENAATLLRQLVERRKAP